MQVVEQVVTAAAMVSSSTCPEPAPGETVWVAGAKAIGDRVISLATHRTYECIQANADKDPANSANAAFWKDVGATMKYRMFDIEREEGTTFPGAGVHVVEIEAGRRIDTVGLVGLDADRVTIEVLLDGVVKRTLSFKLVMREGRGWRDYFFAPIQRRYKVAVVGLPPYSAATIRLTFIKNSGPPTCGTAVLGQAESLGTTKPGATNDARSFSTFDRTAAGGAILIKRKSSPITSQTLNVLGRDFARLERLRARTDAVPCLWLGVDGADSNVSEPLMQIAVHTRFLLEMTDELFGDLQLDLEAP